MAKTAPKAVATVSARFGHDRKRLLDILHAVQSELGQIDAATVDALAAELAMPRVDVAGVVSFYSFFTDKPRGRVVIRLCNDVPDRMLGADRVGEGLEEELGIRFGETTADGLFSLEHTSCIGMSDQAPAALFNDVVIPNLADVKSGEPVMFEYPQPGQRNMLVKIDKSAEEGIGPDQDIVAFSTACAHMGAPLDNAYNHEYSILGPCPLHFSTFDLTKSGMNVMGKASDHLPQVALAIDDNGDIRAIGMFGLIYGYPANLFAREESQS